MHDVLPDEYKMSCTSERRAGGVRTTAPQNGRFGKRKIEADGGFLLTTYWLLNITPQKQVRWKANPIWNLKIIKKIKISI